MDGRFPFNLMRFPPKQAAAAMLGRSDPWSDPCVCVCFCRRVFFGFAAERGIDRPRPEWRTIIIRHSDCPLRIFIHTYVHSLCSLPYSPLGYFAFNLLMRVPVFRRKRRSNYVKTIIHKKVFFGLPRSRSKFVLINADLMCSKCNNV